MTWSIKSLLPYLLGAINLTCFGQYTVTSYTNASGFSHDLTYGLLQDTNGVLWIGTDAGLVRYNGIDFNIFNLVEGLKSNYVIDIAELEDSQKVIATWGGGLHLLKEQKTIYKPTAKDSLYKLKNVIVFKDNFICEFFGDDFFYYKKVDTTYYLSKLSLSKDILIENCDKNTITSHASKVTFKKVFDRVFVYYNTDHSIVLEIHNNLSAVKVFPFLKKYQLLDFGAYESGVFYGLTSNKLLLFTDEKGVFKEIEFPDIPLVPLRFFKKNHLEVFIVKPPDNGEQQVYIKDISTKNTFIVDEKYLKHKMISDILIDKDYNIWITTYGNGLLKIQKDQKLPFLNLVKDQMCVDMIEDNGFYILQRNNICFIDSLLKHTECYPIPESNNFIKKKDEILIFNKEKTQKSFFRFNNKTFRFREDYNSIKYHKDTIYFKHDQLKIERNGNTLTLLSSDDKKEFQKLDINDVIIHKGNLWCASNLGIFIYDLISLRLIKRITSSQGLSNNLVKDIESSDTGVWVATIDGVNKIDGGVITPLDNDLGLPTRQINSLRVDKFNQLWIATQKGVSLYNGENIYNFDQTNGLSSSSIEKIKKDHSGRLWIIGNNGIDILDDFEFKPDKPASLLIDQKKTTFTPELIDYSGKSNILAYQINDNPWKVFKDKNLDFSKYKYGNYQITFRTRKPDSDWNYSDTYNFRIVKPWYKRWYYMAILVVIFCLIVSFTIMLYLKRLKNRNQFLQNTIVQTETLQDELNHARENIAKDFHDELGNKIAGIIVLSELTMHSIDTKNSIQITKRLARIHKDAQSLYSGIKDFIWSIDSKNDNLKELILYLKDFGEDLFMYSNIYFFSQSDLKHLSIKLPHYWSRHLLLMFKEAMTNALRHSEATQVELSVRFSENCLYLELIDNGKGFDISLINRFNGINNMIKRAHMMNGTLSFFVDNGTYILFKTKINNIESNSS
ncbi:ATP-binding protein [Aquimarina sp. RZ0]|uniref:sensor histidine kinase n=1 Tax=Aquimarina sp. RZ0 TaxID=2607730 RepID=UPI0011F203C0|nr:ATP-binding protein [Aquimarina sp. RZ0]KAA1246015.1 hypothetical protein F0000_09890 [Aquimarina sp. RZ0]